MSKPISIEIQGMDKLLSKLHATPAIHAKPVKDALTEMGKIGQSAAQQNAPSDTGRLRAGIRYRVNAGPNPSYVVVRSGTTRKGYPYPRLLEFSGKHGHRDWLLNAIKGAQGRFRATLTGAVRDIEAAWRR